MNSCISIRNARLHNLKNINLDIPKNKFVVLTGISGSGKSTLAFDILNREGQRQYLESLGFIADGLSKPPVDVIITGLSPSISIDQYLTNRNPRSTVVLSPKVHYLRVLFARLGHRPCPVCGRDVPPQTFEAADNTLDEGDESPYEA
jgi:excinuclease ABC subunit A